MSWPTVKLGEICQFNYGKSLPADERRPGGYQVYGSNGPVGMHAAAVTRGPTIVIGRKGSFGEVAYSPAGCWPIDTTFYIDSASTKADLRWLFYRLQKLGLTDLNRAAAVPGLSRDDAYRQQLLLPSLEEQKRIAEVLDGVDALRAKRRHSVALLDDLIQAVFLAMFGDPVSNSRGWQRVKLGEVITRIDSGWSPVCLDRPASADEWGVLKLGAVTSCTFKPSENKALPPGTESREQHEVKAGDLLFSRKNTRELVAACALVKETPPRLLMSDLIFRFVTTGIDRAYLQKLLTYPTKRKKVQELAGGSAGSMPNISKARLLDFEIERPPLDLQQQFAERIETIEAEKAKHRAHLAKLDELFNSVQSRAFAGTLFG